MHSIYGGRNVKKAREVTTEKLAFRLARRLRKEAGLPLSKSRRSGLPKSARGPRGTLAERTEFFAKALLAIRCGDVPAPRKRVSRCAPYIGPFNPHKGMKRKHRLRLRHVIRTPPICMLTQAG